MADDKIIIGIEADTANVSKGLGDISDKAVVHLKMHLKLIH